MVKKKLLWIFIAIIVCIICLYSIGYFIAVSNMSYKIACNFVGNNEEVKSHIGQKIHMRMAFLGYSIKFTGSHGWAEFEMVVKGDQNQGVVFINMEKEVGKWEVRKVQLRLEQGDVIPIHVPQHTD